MKRRREESTGCEGSGNEAPSEQAGGTRAMAGSGTEWPDLEHGDPPIMRTAL